MRPTLVDEPWEEVSGNSLVFPQSISFADESFPLTFRPMPFFSMGPYSKYSSLDHSAPEVVEHQDAPEVRPECTLEPVKRQESGLSPEPYNEPPQYHQENYAKYGAHSNDGDSTLPIHDPPTKSAYYGAGMSGDPPGEEIQEKQDGRRYCGMRKAVFILVIAGIVLLICLAAILGGVLGTVLGKSRQVSWT